MSDDIRELTDEDFARARTNNAYASFVGRSITKRISRPSAALLA